jgi:uncharacterized protein (TIGR02466 family)
LNKINKNDFDEIQLFSTPVYTTFDLESVTLVKQVAEDLIYQNSSDTKMSGSFFHDERIFDFAQYILQTSWNLLKHQGYLMENYNTIYESMWLQTYEKHSYMEHHTHGNGNQIVGFYFLEVPEKSVQVLLHDPRAGKLQIDLDESDISQVTQGSRFVVLTPQVGQLILTPAWLAHSVTANQSDKPVKFVHINIQAQRVANNQSCATPEVEII